MIQFLLVIIVVILMVILYVVDKVGSLTHMDDLTSTSRSGGGDAGYANLPITTNDLDFVTGIDKNSELYNCHHGQRKLFLTEVQLLTHATNMINTADIKKPLLFVYAGAAPCMHFRLIKELFPHATYLLVDPREFFIVDSNNKPHYGDPSFIYLKSGKETIYPIKNETPESRLIYTPDGTRHKRGEVDATPVSEIMNVIDRCGRGKTYICEDYFTVELAAALKNNTYFTVFMSDIRSNSRGGYAPFEVDITWNNAQFFNWVCAMQPELASHKHRCIFEGDDFGPIQDYMNADFELAKNTGIDFLNDYRMGKFTFFDGVAYLQAWTSKSSTETRLFIERDDVRQPDHEIRKPNVMTQRQGFSYMKIPDDYEPDLTKTRIPGVPYAITNHDIILYDQQLLMHNHMGRMKKYYNKYVDYKEHIDGCFDCTLEAYILEQYNQLPGVNKIDVKKYMAQLNGRLGCVGSDDNYKSLRRLHYRK